jgi:hypothetical protein
MNSVVVFTALTGLLGIVLGWVLNGRLDDWRWRRKEHLGAYLGFLEAADRFSPACHALWALGVLKRDSDWVAGAAGVRQLLAEIDRAGGHVRLAGTRNAGVLSLNLYVASSKMLRRAMVTPAATEVVYTAAVDEMVQAYHRFVDQGRSDLALTSWIEEKWMRWRGESFSDLAQRRLAELEISDPVSQLPSIPAANTPGASANQPTQPSS